MLIGPLNTLYFSCAVIRQVVKNSKGKHVDRWGASLLSSRRVLVKLQLLKKPLKLLPLETQQTFPCKYTFLTDSNASLWLFSSVNHEKFLEIYFAKINNINFPRHQTGYWQKLLKKCFRKLSSTRIIIKGKWHKFFSREVLIGHFQEHTLN